MRPTAADQPDFRRALRTLVPQDGHPGGDHAEIFRGIVEEVGDPIGGLLERSLCDVRRWATTPPGRRGVLFRGERGLRRTGELHRIGPPGVLSGPLRTIRDMLISPGAVPPRRVATACRTVARWAWERNHPRTSIAFRLAATLTLPESPGAALGLARVLGELAQWTVAEQWLGRAEALVGERGGVEAVRTILLRADMMTARGELDEAVELYGAVLARAAAHRPAELRAPAHHGLCVIDARTDRLDEAEDHAARAIRLYGSGHRDTPAVLREIAFIRLERGAFVAALPLLAALVPTLSPHPRVAGLGSLARAAGGVGDEATFEEARHALERSTVNRWSGEAWLEVARGALLLGDPEEAGELVDRAIIVGMERREGRILDLADEFLDVVEGEDAAGRLRRSRVRCSDTVRSLTSDLLGSIRAGAPGGNGPIG